MSTQIGWCVFTWLCQCHLELERAKNLSSFCFVYFSSYKKFNLSSFKNGLATIFHLKLGGSCRLSYFSTSTLMHPRAPRWTHCKSTSENNRMKMSGACSLAHNTSGVEGHAKVPGWGFERLTSNSITFMALHKPNNKLVSG
jgi:hypothetical protein